MYGVGTVVYTCVIFTVTGKLALETRYWTWLNFVAVFGSMILWFIFSMVYGTLWVSAPGLGVGAEVYMAIIQLYQTPLFWWTIIITPFICLWRDFSWK
jgi:hypothetical protein